LEFCFLWSAIDVGFFFSELPFEVGACCRSDLVCFATLRLKKPPLKTKSFLFLKQFATFAVAQPPFVIRLPADGKNLSIKQNTMPFNPTLDDKLQRITAQWPHAERKKMFGGTGYLVNGNMVTGVYKDLLVLRVGKNEEEELLTQPWCRPMDITGKPMKGWLFVEAEGWDNDQRLNELVARARDFVETLPKK